MIKGITPGPEVVECPVCETLIHSHSPVCSGCGLVMSEVEVLERAEINERSRQARSTADDLFGYATVAVVYVILAEILGSIFDPPLAFGEMFISAIALAMFWWRYFAWGRRFGRSSLDPRLLAEATDTRRRTLMIGVALSGLVAGLIYLAVR